MHTAQCTHTYIGDKLNCAELNVGLSCICVEQDSAVRGRNYSSRFWIRSSGTSGLRGTRLTTSAEFAAWSSSRSTISGKTTGSPGCSLLSVSLTRGCGGCGTCITALPTAAVPELCVLRHMVRGTCHLARPCVVTAKREWVVYVGIVALSKT